MTKELEALKAFVDKEEKVHRERDEKQDVLLSGKLLEFAKLTLAAIESLKKEEK